MKPTTNAIFASLSLLLLLSDASAQAQEIRQRQDLTLVRDSALLFLHAKTADQPGKVGITLGSLDARMNLNACAAPEAFLPSGSKTLGKTTVGVRCRAPSPWTVYLQAHITVETEYIATAKALTQGQIITQDQIVKTKGDLSTLPAGVITDPAQAIGRIAGLSLPAGAPVRAEALRNQPVIQQGQAVRLISSGPGFRVSAEATALAAASEGQLVQVKTSSGQLISGVAKVGGMVEVIN